MEKEAENKISIPSLAEIQCERKRIRRGAYYRQALRGTVSVLVVVAAVAVLVATLFLPILQISGDSMSPTLEHDEVVVLVKTKEFDRGDLIGFYYQGKILLKRVIALPEDELVIDSEGNVYVNEELLEEPYVTDTYRHSLLRHLIYIVIEESRVNEQCVVSQSLNTSA